MFGVVDVISHKTNDSLPKDWQKCILRQKGTNEKLVDPSLKPIRKAPGTDDGYETLATNLEQFHDIGALPFPLDFPS